MPAPERLITAWQPSNAARSTVPATGFHLNSPGLGSRRTRRATEGPSASRRLFRAVPINPLPPDMRMRIGTGYVAGEGALTKYSRRHRFQPIPLLDTSRRKACSVESADQGSSFDPPRLEAPPSTGQPFLPPASSTGFTPAPPPPFVPQDGPPTATVVAQGNVGKRSRGKMVGGLIAVVALLGAGGFAVSKIVAGDDGGAANPAEVGTRLMDSLEAEDALGVVDLLLPGERDTMRQPLIDFLNHLKRLKIVDESANLDKVGGIDLSFEDVQVETT